MDGMVLAAGYGNRLRPLTEIWPKPSLPAANQPLIYWAVQRLQTAGIDRIVVNIHYRPEFIKESLEHLIQSSKISFSFEENILGTGGGILKAKEFLKSEPFVVTNGDTLLNIDLKDVIDWHIKTDAIATMVVVQDNRAKQFGEVFTDPFSTITDIAGLTGYGGKPMGLFAGTHILSKKIFDLMPEKSEKFCIIRDVYIPIIKSGSRNIKAFISNSHFEDLGSPSDYLKGNLHILSNPLSWPAAFAGYRNEGQVWLWPDATIKGKVIGPAMIGPACIIEKESIVGPNVILGAECNIEAGTILDRSVLLPKTHLNPGLHYQNVIAWPHGKIHIQN